jgi:hypothetical protein
MREPGVAPIRAAVTCGQAGDAEQTGCSAVDARRGYVPMIAACGARPLERAVAARMAP